MGDNAGRRAQDAAVAEPLACRDTLYDRGRGVNAAVPARIPLLTFSTADLDVE